VQRDKNEVRDIFSKRIAALKLKGEFSVKGSVVNEFVVIRFRVVTNDHAIESDFICYISGFFEVVCREIDIRGFALKARFSTGF